MRRYVGGRLIVVFHLQFDMFFKRPVVSIFAPFDIQFISRFLYVLSESTLKLFDRPADDV